MIWAAVIVAAGRGTRFGGPKQLVEIAGQPMVAWSIACFASMPEVAELVVVTEPEFVERVFALATARVDHASVRVVPGGDDRQESVRRGLAAVEATEGGVLVHDGARPLIRPEDVRAGMRVVRPGVAALLTAPVIDTIKRVDEDGRVRATLDRAILRAAQTPQFATLRDLRDAHESAAGATQRATDDAQLLERAGIEVRAVPGSPDNIKLTHPGDVARVEPLLRAFASGERPESEVLVVECYVDPRAVDAVLEELERRSARIDGIERDLPSAVAIRAYADAAALRGLGHKLHALAGEDALYTTHLSHLPPRGVA